MVPNDKMERESKGDIVPYKQRYRELKRRLKYLVYENECFEHDVRQAQTKLLQLCREKSFLLDQLMRHETVVLSEDSDNETTDYSTDDDDQMDISAKSTVSKLSKPSLSSSLAKPTTSKSSTKTTPNAKKTAQKGVIKQVPTGKGAKTIAKTLNSVKTATPKPALIVSLPFTSIGQPSTTAASLMGGGVGGGISVVPSVPVLKRTRSTSSSSSSGSSSSSSDSDSDDSSSQSSSSSDREIEPMDTIHPSHPPPLLPSPLPRMVDRSPAVTGSKVVHPRPIPSPVTVISPNQLTSLALVSPSGIPLISPLPSPADPMQKGAQTTYTLTATSKGSFQLVPLTKALTTSNTKMLASLPTSSGMSAFHVVSSPTSQQPPSGQAPGQGGSGGGGGGSTS